MDRVCAALDPAVNLHRLTLSPSKVDAFLFLHITLVSTRTLHRDPPSAYLPHLDPDDFRRCRSLISTSNGSYRLALFLGKGSVFRHLSQCNEFLLTCRILAVQSFVANQDYVSLLLSTAGAIWALTTFLLLDTDCSAS